LDQIGLDFTMYVSDLVKSNESYQIKFLSDAYLSYAGFTLISIELNSFVFISSILNSSSSIQYKFFFEKYVELLIEKYLIDIIVNIIININFII
jgi:hypothetical protein